MDHVSIRPLFTYPFHCNEMFVSLKEQAECETIKHAKKPMKNKSIVHQCITVIR